MTSQWYLFLFLVIYFLLTFFLRSYLVWRNTGVSPMTFGGTDDAHGYNGRLFKLISFLEIVVVGIYAFLGSWYEYLLPFWYLENGAFQIFGWVLLHLSLIWVAIAQLQMADSWRIGIDTINKTDLVTKGLFSISRNPIFLVIILANIGLFLVIPNAFTLLIAIVSTTTTQTQVRLEEDFLRASHNKDYSDYCKKVRRWI